MQQQEDLMGNSKDQNSMIKIVMFPWLAYGHISPFIELAKSLITSNKNFHIYLCSTPVNLNSIKSTNHSLFQPNYADSIEFIELNLPDLPPHYQTTNGLPPNLMPKLKKSCQKAMPNFYQILQRITPHLLIYDFLQEWAPMAAARLNIPAVLFFSTGAATTCFFNYLRTGKNLDSFPFKAIYIRDDIEHSKIDKIMKPNNNTDPSQPVDLCIKRSCDIILIRSSRALESKYIDYLSVLCEKTIVPVGPLIHPTDQKKIKQEEGEEETIMNWLEGKAKSSTVFASFGSEYFLTEDEIEEIAHGLELSGVNFIWAVRFPRSEAVVCLEEKLPKGFLERNRDKGMVVNGWVPQRRILGHQNIGGFMSHCGWGSVMEGLSYGVPIIAAPMHLDQPMNSRLVEEMGVGFEVKRDGESGRFERGEIGRVVREVVSGERGEVMRRRVREVVTEMRSREEEDMNGVVGELIKVCCRNRGRGRGGGG
ncbi:UDP-glucosyltransferase 29-like [Impatiens glandulifera]|uniref:UDP-glucosyltransferase 29-like n=1 Tax=Impatiens glandulifera TaxID=253017 RepID=UPI001FB077A4|nr:UDP-glucosyltransferase 29-like [Impatiens glandulifera]